MTRQGLTLERAGAVAVVTLDHPPVNALSLALCESLRDTFGVVSAEPGVACIVLAAAGSRAFCAGLDREDFVQAADVEPERKAGVLRDLYAAVRACPVPVVAAIDGPAIGAGAVIAAACDVRVASARASFALPEITVGRVGGAAWLQPLLPPGTLRRMVLTGEAMKADAAFRLGLVDEVADDPFDAAMRLATSIAAKGRLAVVYAKRGLAQIEGCPADEGYRREQQLNAEYRTTADAREAARAWVEKRPPRFIGE